MKLTNEKYPKREQKYYDESVQASDWNSIEKELKKLLQEEVHSVDDLITQLEKESELSSIVFAKHIWLHVRMSCNADKEEYIKAFNDFNSEIMPKLTPLTFELQKKFYNNEYFKKLPAHYDMLRKTISQDLKLYTEKNIALDVEEAKLSSEYGTIRSKQTIRYEGKEHTLESISAFLESPDREKRKEVWLLIFHRLLKDREIFNKNFDAMKKIRIQKAKNAGFKNYRDYAHALKKRFSYTSEDLLCYHNAIEKIVVPFARELNDKKRIELGYESLRPWDEEIEPDGLELKPYNSVTMLIEKGIEVMHKVDPEFALDANIMDNTGLLDLDNRKGKAPGGFCTPIFEYDSSFIFMNGVGIHEDILTLFHELGHAIHFRMTKDEPIINYRFPPAEVAELASMSMELLTMPYWNVFYNEKEHKSAMKRQLLKSVSGLISHAFVDAFQHWIYTNPEHTVEQREDQFLQLRKRFNVGFNYDGLESLMKNYWVRIPHIFMYPFYMIEYSFARLGSLAIYKNYKKDKAKALRSYKNFMKLGYSRSVKEIYREAGITFDFSEDYLKEVVTFIRKELNDLQPHL